MIDVILTNKTTQNQMYFSFDESEYSFDLMTKGYMTELFNICRFVNTMSDTIDSDLKRLSNTLRTASPDKWEIKVVFGEIEMYKFTDIRQYTYNVAPITGIEDAKLKELVTFGVSE